MPQSRPKKQPDWNEFYRNGVPQEIIVIDDDSPPPQKQGNEVGGRGMPNGTEPSGEHINKKRRTGAAQDASSRMHASYSNTNTPHYVGSGSDTVSTGRTTSLHTTAPTSLGSHRSGGSGGAYADNTVVGQKRKRVTRQTAADEKKRKEVEVSDAYDSYVPPARPPVKSKEVNVRVVRDVSLMFSSEKSVKSDDLLERSTHAAD